MDAEVLYDKFLNEDDFESSSRKAICFVEMSTIHIGAIELLFWGVQTVLHLLN